MAVRQARRRAVQTIASLGKFAPRGLADPARATSPLEPFGLNLLRHERRSRNEAIFRSVASPVYLGDGTALCRVLGHHKMLVDTSDHGHSLHLLLDGFWEMDVTEAMRAVLRPGMHAVDVGANIGYYTLLMARLVGEGGRVHAFEPNPAAAARLRRNLEMNGIAHRAAVYEAPLADADGQEVALVVPEGDPKNASLVPTTVEVGPDRVRHVVRTRRLDALLGDAPVDFVKIDAEGAEQAVWQGMRGILDRRAKLTVFLEFLTKRYTDPAGFLAELRQEGFALARVDPERGVVPTAPDEVLELGRTRDVILFLSR